MTVLLVLGAVGCDSEPTAPTQAGSPTPTAGPATPDVSGPAQLLLVPQLASAGGVEPRQVGDEPVRLSVVTLDGGVVESAQSWDGSDAFGLPAYDGTSHPPRAVIAVRPGESDPDALSPGAADFEFGADFMLDAESSGSPVDNGDNLIQRGLASDPHRFKAELDGRRPACTVRGSRGQLVARADMAVEAGRWYRLRCLREGGELVIRVVEYDAEGQVRAASASARGPLGDVSPPPAAPLSVGGKLSQAGRVIASATDQFNGAVANPILMIDRPPRLG